MARIQLHKDYLINELNLPDDAIHFEVADDSGRWTNTVEIIFSDKGKFYRAYYKKGKTEQQYIDPWEYEELIECQEVELKEVTVKKWVGVQ